MTMWIEKVKGVFSLWEVGGHGRVGPGSGARLPEFIPHLYHSLAVGPRASH